MVSITDTSVARRKRFVLSLTVESAQCCASTRGSRWPVTAFRVLESTGQLGVHSDARSNSLQSVRVSPRFRPMAFWRMTASICDRDAKWSRPVREVLQEAGIRIVRTPYRAPNANAYAERFVRSIKEECLDRIIPFGERHFRRSVYEFVVHYHLERNHQGLGNELIDRVAADTVGAIRRRPRLGGLLNYYERAA